jgi:pimeloyl-ACP methyl ester carboxylesterase
MGGDGFVEVEGFKTYFRIAGGVEAPGRHPVLVLHGGPGLPHPYLEPLDRLATGRRVVYYDQIGCGNSDVPDAAYEWSMDTLVRQVAATRSALDLDGPVHLYGQSFGGFLALEHVLRGGSVASLILADTAASMPKAAEGMLALRGGDPSPEAHQAFMRKHFFGGDGSVPEPVGRAFSKLGAACYTALWGVGLAPSGPLKDWDVSDRLGRIAVPTLIFNGRDDEIPPACGEAMHHAIAGSEFHVFEDSAHLPMHTEPDAHDRLVGSFLERVEAA